MLAPVSLFLGAAVWVSVVPNQSLENDVSVQASERGANPTQTDVKTTPSRYKSKARYVSHSLRFILP